MGGWLSGATNTPNFQPCCTREDRLGGPPSQVHAIGSKVHTHRNHLWYTLCGHNSAFAPSPGDRHLGSSHHFAFVDTADTYVLRQVPADGARPWSGSPALGQGMGDPQHQMSADRLQGHWRFMNIPTDSCPHQCFLLSLSKCCQPVSEALICISVIFNEDMLVVY